MSSNATVPTHEKKKSRKKHFLIATFIGLFLYMPPCCVGCGQYDPYFIGPDFMYSISHMASAGKLPGVIIYLTLVPGDVNRVDRPFDSSPLDLALSEGHFVTALYIMHKGGTISHYNHKEKKWEGGQWKIFRAGIMGGNKRWSRTLFARYMIYTGMEVNPKDAGWPPLYSATRASNEKIVRLLLSMGANVNAQTPKGETALMASGCSPQISRVLINAGADVSIVNNDGEAFIHKLVISDCAEVEIINSLIKKGTNINLRNNQGKTALQLSLLKSPTITELLLRHGADPHIKDNNNLSAFDYCVPIKYKIAQTVTCNVLKNSFPEEYSSLENKINQGQQ